LAAGLVDGERAGDADGVAVLGAEAEERGLAAEEDDGKLGFRVLEGEVAMAAGGGAPVGDFAFDGDVAVGALDEVADVADEVAYGKDLRGSCAEGGCVLRGVLLERRRFGACRRGAGGEGAGLFGEDVGGGDIWCDVEEGGRGGRLGAWGGLAGTGAAEVGEAGDVVRHRRDEFTMLLRDGRGDSKNGRLLRKRDAGSSLHSE